MLADRGYEADWCRNALKVQPGRKPRGKVVRYHKRRYRRRNRIQIMFGRLNDWRGISTSDYRMCQTVFSAIAIASAATDMFWL